MKVQKMDREDMRNSEAGSILLQVAIGLVVLIAFASFVVDQGLMYVGRTQAQTTADGAALAGAIAWAFDEANHATPDANGFVVQSINNVSGKHQIGDQATHATTRAFGTVPDATGVCPAFITSLPNGTNCVRVNVYQNGENSSTRLPVFFSTLIGVTSQGTKATATAIAAVANGTNCLKPWLIPDKFTDVNMNGAFDVGVDSYSAPGWTIADIGRTLTLNPGRPQDAAGPSLFYQIDENNYADDIRGCELTVGIGGTVWTAPGLSAGLTRNAVNDLLAANNGGPVVVPIGMFSPVEFSGLDRSTGHFPLTIVNMLGFKLTGMTGNALYGTIVAMPGELITGAGLPGANASFLKVIRLIQ